MCVQGEELRTAERTDRARAERPWWPRSILLVVRVPPLARRVRRTGPRAELRPRSLPTARRRGGSVATLTIAAEGQPLEGNVWWQGNNFTIIGAFGGLAWAAWGWGWGAGRVGVREAARGTKRGKEVWR